MLAGYKATISSDKTSEEAKEVSALLALACTILCLFTTKARR